MSPPEIRSSLDTSVVMRLLTGQPLDLAKAARRYMAETEQAGAKVFVSNLVILEACFACQHHYGMAKNAVLAGLQYLLSMPTFVVHPKLLKDGGQSRGRMVSSVSGFLPKVPS